VLLCLYAGRFGGNVCYFKYVLKCVAVCCSMLQWFTVCCIASMLADLAGTFDILSVCCSMLQYVAVVYGVLHRSDVGEFGGNGCHIGI